MTVSSRVWLPLISLLCLLCLWEFGLRLSGLDQQLFPPPSNIALKIVDLVAPRSDGAVPTLLLHVSVSVGRLAAAMIIALFLGTAIGLLMGTNRVIYRILYPTVNALNPIPPFAYIPILLLWSGRGSISIILVTSLSASLPIIYNTMAGVRGVDRGQVRAIRTFGAGRLDIARYVLVPAALTEIIAALRLSFGQAWRTLVGAEFIAAPSAGIGYMVFNARNLLQVDVMFAGLVAMGLFGFLFIYVLVGKIENHTLVRWGMLKQN